MLNNLLYIVWDFDPAMFTIGGFELRYYGLMWAITILLGERFFVGQGNECLSFAQSRIYYDKSLFE